MVQEKQLTLPFDLDRCLPGGVRCTSSVNVTSSGRSREGNFVLIGQTSVEFRFKIIFFKVKMSTLGHDQKSLVRGNNNCQPHTLYSHYWGKISFWKSSDIGRKKGEKPKWWFITPRGVRPWPLTRRGMVEIKLKCGLPRRSREVNFILIGQTLVELQWKM